MFPNDLVRKANNRLRRNSDCQNDDTPYFNSFAITLNIHDNSSFVFCVSFWRNICW